MRWVNYPSEWSSVVNDEKAWEKNEDPSFRGHPSATRSFSVPFSNALSFVVKALTSLCKEHLSIRNWLSSWTSAAFSSDSMHIQESFRASPYMYHYTTLGVSGIFSPASHKMRRSAITWLAKRHWPSVACPSFPWRWSDCFSLRGWWLVFPLISSVSSFPITQTATDEGNEAEDTVTLVVTGWISKNWISWVSRILWLKFQKGELKCAWNMCFVEPLAARLSQTYPGLQWKALVAVDILANMDVVEPPDLLDLCWQHQPFPASIRAGFTPTPSYVLSTSILKRFVYCNTSRATGRGCGKDKDVSENICHLLRAFSNTITISTALKTCKSHIFNPTKTT